jgi:hypothetical protein
MPLKDFENGRWGNEKLQRTTLGVHTFYAIESAFTPSIKSALRYEVKPDFRC